MELIMDMQILWMLNGREECRVKVRSVIRAALTIGDGVQWRSSVLLLGIFIGWSRKSWVELLSITRRRRCGGWIGLVGCVRVLRVAVEGGLGVVGCVG